MSLADQYDIMLSRVDEMIEKHEPNKVLVQLPDGLKPRADEIVRHLERKGVEALIWAGSCFGSCDVPLEVDRLGVDLVLQWGHSNDFGITGN